MLFMDKNQLLKQIKNLHHSVNNLQSDVDILTEQYMPNDKDYQNTNKIMDDDFEKVHENIDELKKSVDK